MENLLIVYGNSTDESTNEEMNLWYSWVHIRDVLTHRAALAAQRFELSKWQPRNFCDKHTVLCCYEIMDREYSPLQETHIVTFRCYIVFRVRFNSHVIAEADKRNAEVLEDIFLKKASF